MRVLIAAAIAAIGVLSMPGRFALPRRRSTGFGAAADRPSVIARRLGCSTRFRRRRVVRDCARRAGAGRVRKARQRPADARRDGIGLYPNRSDDLGVLRRRGRAIARGAAIGGQSVRGRDRRGCASAFRRERARLDDRRAPSRGAEPGRYARSDVRCRRRRPHAGWPATGRRGLSLQEDRGEQRVELRARPRPGSAVAPSAVRCGRRF